MVALHVFRLVPRAVVCWLALGVGTLVLGAEPEPTLFDALGGKSGIAALVEVFAVHLFEDPHTGPFFKGAVEATVRERLEAQFCDVAGGPCKTINPNMKKTHSGMDIREQDFVNVIDLLKQSMNDRHLQAETQIRFLAKLTSMRQDIVNTP